MDMQNDKHSIDLLHAQAHIWNHTFSFIRSMSLKCAIELQIPDIIDRHGAPMLLSELVEALSINKERTNYVYRLMRILIQSGFFVTQTISNGKEEKEAYLLAPVSRSLLNQEPLSTSPFVLGMLDPGLMEPWQHMSKWFQNDDVNPFYTTHGMMFWVFAGQDSKHNQFFNEAMASDARLVTSVMLRHYGDGFKKLNSVVDVGGGTGTVAKAIADAFPNISCICFDLPHVLDGLNGSNNLSYVCGDMFEAIPKADAVLLKWILHDWNDEDCIKILKRCKEAIPNRECGGKLIIIDMVLKNDEVSQNSLETQLFFDMVMMVDQTGRERTEEEWAKLFFDAKFGDYKIIPILGLRSIIEVYP
ncbi:hypothetical protein LXL04_017549 [Taraxacum kok-saghyz]